MSGEYDTNDLTLKTKYLIEEQSRTSSSPAVFSSVMSKFADSGLQLIGHTDQKDLVKIKMAGIVIFDCLFDINDELAPERRNEISNFLMKIFDNDRHEVVLNAAASAIGHFARVASTSELDNLQAFYFPFAMELLEKSSESQRYAGAIVLNQLAINSPALIFSRRRDLFQRIWDKLSDKSYLVRQACAHTLNATLQLTSQRETMNEYIATALSKIKEGLPKTSPAEKTIGSLTILNIILRGVIISIADLQKIIQARENIQDVIWRVLQRKDPNDPAEVRAKVIEIIPNLASAFPVIFVQRNSYTTGSFLEHVIKYLKDIIQAKRDRGHAFVALGKLYVALPVHFSSTEIRSILQVISGGMSDPFCPQALTCLGLIVSVSPAMRDLVDSRLIDLMFRGGISPDLIDNLTIVLANVGSVRKQAQAQLRTHVSSILNKYKPVIEEGKGGVGNAARYARGTSVMFGGAKDAAKAGSWLFTHLVSYFPVVLFLFFL